MNSLPTIKQNDSQEYDESAMRTVIRIQTQAPLIFARLLEKAIDNNADYLTVLDTVMEQMVLLKNNNSNGKIVIHAGSEKGRRTHAVELRVITKKIVEIVDIYKKP